MNLLIIVKTKFLIKNWTSLYLFGIYLTSNTIIIFSLLF